MKTLLTILLCVFALTANGQGYNVATDKYINTIIAEKPITASSNYSDMFKQTTYKFQYEECIIRIYHELYEPYQQEETWRYTCTLRNGKELSLDWIGAENKVSKNTLLKLRQMCYKLDKSSPQ